MEVLLSTYQKEHQNLVRNGVKGEDALINAYNSLMEIVKSKKYTKQDADVTRENMIEIRECVINGKHPTFTIGCKVRKQKMEKEDNV